jgi:hypothetical protein
MLRFISLSINTSIYYLKLNHNKKSFMIILLFQYFVIFNIYYQLDFNKIYIKLLIILRYEGVNKYKCILIKNP